MNEALKKAIVEAYALAPSDKAVLDTLELQLSGEPSIYIYRGVEPLSMKLETGAWVVFEPIPFRFKLPKSAETSSQSLDITIDNVDSRISDFVMKAKQSLAPVKVIYRPYLSSDLATPQMDPPMVLYLKGVSITENTCTAKASFVDIVNKRFPNDYYTSERFPGLR